MNVKALKEHMRLKAAMAPEKFFAVNFLKSEGFHRKKCKCGKYYWSIDSPTCGEPGCSGGFRFIGRTPSKNPMSYTQVWKQFSKQFEAMGYTPINRYPVAARWRSDTDFVQASIYNFQPYVVSGEVDPPANPLVVPQFCLRFNDIENVGLTGAHNTGFSMIGQHAFVDKSQWDVESYFSHIYTWITKGLKLPKKEVMFHEDGWAGGGNAGACMEFFSRGVELGNQVYMTYQATPEGNKPLPLRVLDMGMGQERNAWFSQGSETLYDAVFPNTLKDVFKKTGYKKDVAFLKKFTPHAALLNTDEVKDIGKVWKKIAKLTGERESYIKETILPLQALYSITEHSRSLLVALNDGVLPSNVKGGYNLRVLLRRSLNFIAKYDWDLELADIAQKHAKELHSMYPELMENLANVTDILHFEKKKYAETKLRNKQLITGLLKKNNQIPEKQLLQLYDSQGITPEEIQEEAKLYQKNIVIPDNFYGKISNLHEQKEQNTQTKKEKKLDVHGPPTTILYYDHFDKVTFEGEVTWVKDNFVVLDQSAFYPTSGGQLHDLGTLNQHEVVNVFKEGPYIIHEVKHHFKKGNVVKGHIDIARRTQLAQHHTATHILNGVAKKILGSHIWQAGASKSLEKARLDITHYDTLTKQQTEQIELEANKIVAANLPVFKSIMPRHLAEAKYGFSLYQGGAVPGKQLRIVEIQNLDVEACGGTHLDVTGDVGYIKIIKTSKIQDGVVRLEYTAGKASDTLSNETDNLISNISKLLNCTPEEIPGRAEELFLKWKSIVKKKKNMPAELTSIAKYHGDVLKKTSEILKTQPEHIEKTLLRFIHEIKKSLT